MFAVNTKNLKISYISKTKHQIFLLFTVSVVINIKNIYKEEEPSEILKILDLITNVEEQQKI